MREEWTEFDGGQPWAGQTDNTGDVCEAGGGTGFGRQGRSVSSSETMERSWKKQIVLTITTVMGTSFNVRVSPDETVLDIKKRIYYREG